MTTTADTSKGPDIKQLADRDLPKGTFPGEGRNDFRISVGDSVHKEIQKHAKEKKDVEICGVLVGKWGRDDKGPFVAITASIRGEAATSKFAEVTFTHDTWSKINAEMDKSYAGYNIVGWYHTHPDFGIFLSDRDRFIHENFFSEPGQVAYVVDPIRDIEGFFIWQGGKPVPAPFYWTGEKMRTAPAEKDPRTMKLDDKRSSNSGSRDSRREDDAPPSDGGMLTWATLVLGALCVFMLGFMVSNWLAGSQMQKLFEAVAAAQQLERIRLNEQLTAVSQQLQEDARRIEAQSRAQANMGENERQMISKAVFDLRATGMGLDQMARQFGISVSDLAHVNALIDRTQLAMDAMRTASTQSSAGSTTAPAMAPLPAPDAAPTSSPVK